MCARLGTSRLLLLEPGPLTVTTRVRLHCTRDDAVFALRDDALIAALQAS